MELIPILSTIILVATISTFILAVGAYILYKIRERKYEEAPAHVTEMRQAELVEPEEIPQEKVYVENIVKPVTRVVKPEVRYRPVKETETFYSPQYVARNEREPVKQTRVEHKIVPEVPVSRFLKYTEEGYVAPEEDTDNGEIKWR
ncbi:MAG: hypothetical protein DRQ13_07705 [Ignavibacteriae bacterium]|nr:MAG: hypothetical protein DRQ13_07705 [Ignavibacteriota bacterium]